MARAAAANCAPLLDQNEQCLPNGAPQPLCQHQGKAILAVNTASLCALTAQHQGPAFVDDKYWSCGRLVIGFLANDFGRHGPGSNQEFADLGRMTCGPEFPIISKTEVAESKTSAFDQQPIEKTGTRPKSNVHKYLTHRDGIRAGSRSSLTAPDNRALLTHIERWLAEKPSSTRQLPV